jgi:dipeptidyl aminopeptidase/acylaminoacyl peptidase
MGAATRPDLFRCAISYAGVTDLESMYDTAVVGDGWTAQRSSESMVYLTHTLGERRDTEFLRKQSPVYNAANINCPVFIAHGRLDVVVQINNAHRMRDALQDAHKVVDYLEKPEEGHGFHYEQNVIELYTRIEQFLQKYNPPD